VLILSACGSGSSENHSASGDSVNSSNEDTRIYQSENGPVEVPENPQRIVVLASFAGNVMALDGNLAGVDQWSKRNPNFKEELEGVTQVSADSLEKIVELNPDLIIGLSSTKNIDKLQKIAPTVTYTYGNLNYLEQHIEIGKLLNKEEEARAWVEDFQQRAQEAGEQIKNKIGEDATVSVIESYNKQLYVYGPNWGRGTEILYQEMGLPMPEKVKQATDDAGYLAISREVLPEYAGDYIILSTVPGAENSFMQTETWQNIPAVQNDRVFKMNMYAFNFNDPLTLELQLDFFTDKFLGK